MYKIIACDLDETLLNKERKVSSKNREAIDKARAMGVKFVPATGRGFMMVQDILEDLGMHDSEGEYVISFNGGAITENKENKEIVFTEVPFELAERIFKLGEKYDSVGLHLYTDTDIYIYRFNEEERHLLDSASVHVIDSPNIAFAKDMKIAKVIYQSLDMPLLFSIHDELVPFIGEEVSMSFSSNRYIEINTKGIDKGTTLLKFADMLGVPHEQTMAIGDNLNDMSMLKAAGLSIGVSNSVPAIKEVVDVITEASHDEDAIAEILERFVFNK